MAFIEIKAFLTLYANTNTELYFHDFLISLDSIAMFQSLFLYTYYWLNASANLPS